MLKVFTKTPDDKQIVHFTSPHTYEVIIGEQNHYNQKRLAGSETDFEPHFIFGASASQKIYCMNYDAVRKAALSTQSKL